MDKRHENIGNPPQGYTLVEMLIVTSIILILASVPIALLRRSKVKIYEAEAIRSLNMLALAYENYYALNDHAYPNFRSNHQTGPDIRFRDAEEIWDTLIREHLLPFQYSGYSHNRRDLLARGYILSIYPVDIGTSNLGAANNYAFALFPYPGSVAKRGIAMIQGNRFYTVYPSALPRKTGMGLYSIGIYRLPD